MARLLLDTHLVLWWHSGIPILTSSLVVPPGHGQQNVARTPLIGRLEVVEGHRDPFDRLLVARSRCEPMLLLSADRKLEANGTTLRLV